MKRISLQTTFLLLITLLAFTNCNSKKVEKPTETTSPMVISDTLKWSERFALTIMREDTFLWQVNNYLQPSWNYKHGLLALSFQQLYNKTGNEAYFDYAKGYADALVDSSGTIGGYKLEKYNIDNINAGKILFDIYEKTKEPKYLTALQTLRKQLETHPRTPSGGFWHKAIYPNQMWLDGLYMGQPFYVRYNVEFENGDKLDDITHQFALIYEKTLDEKTGLLLHAWDESKKMPWADKESGKSPNFWSRSMGWYCMALVDVLDYFPAEDSRTDELIGYLYQLSTALVKVQDSTGLWYQVTNMADREGNYLESSGSAMFIYAFAKGVNKGYLPEEFKTYANKGFDGLIKELVDVDEDGEVHVNQVCKSAGLGGDPYRDGSYEYYLSEPILTDNLHGLGPVILAALELNR